MATYKANESGKAPNGLSVGDKVVTKGGTYEITTVFSDGSYGSSRVSNTNTSNYSGNYANTGKESYDYTGERGAALSQTYTPTYSRSGGGSSGGGSGNSSGSGYQELVREAQEAAGGASDGWRVVSNGGYDGDTVQTLMNILNGGGNSATVQKYLSAVSAAQQVPAMTQVDLQSLLNYTPPSYSSAWDETKEALARAALEMNYDDWTRTGQYQALVDRYGHNGRLSMQDVLGQVSSRTGGMASSYAATAAQQRYNEYMAELEDAARSMYSGERSDAIQNAQLAYDYSDNDYQRYLDQLSQFNADRSYAFDVLSQALAQSNYANEWQNKLDQQALERQAATDAQTVYGYSSNGNTYKISSARGLNFINNAAAGATMSDTGDGSKWTKNDDGSVTITKGGMTYTVTGSGTGNDFQSLMASAQKLLNAGNNADYIYAALKYQGYSDEMIDLVFAQLGL